MRAARTATVVFATFGLAFASAASVAAERRGGSCTHDFTEHRISPNGSWDALVDEDYCLGDAPMTTDGVTTVTVISRARPALREDVYACDTSGSKFEIPIVEWTSSDELRIRTHGSRLVTFRRTRFAGVRITYVR